MSKNDAKIMELKAKIDKKRELLSQVPKFNPETNCSIELDGTRYNLHAATKPDLVFLLCKLHALNTAAEDLGCTSELVIGGYTAEVWMNDVRARLASLDYLEETKKLKSLESKLNSMLSDDKKTELELEGIADLLD